MTDLSWLTARPIAHRGFHDLNRLRWENTLSAFRAAIDNDFAIECDVHLSSDGIPVVFHDHDLKRLAGVEGHVLDRTATEMAACRIGGTQDQAPTLDEVLALVDGRVPLVIELKGTEGRDDGLASAVMARVRAYSGKAAVMSFDHWLIRQLVAKSGDVPVGLTAHGGKTDELEAHFSMLAHPISFVSFGVHDLPNPFVDFVREKLSMPVITWTVRNPDSESLTATHADQMTFEGFNPDTRGPI